MALIHLVPFHPIVVQRKREDWHQIGVDVGGGALLPVKGASMLSLLRRIWQQNVHAHGRGFPFPEMSGLFAKTSLYTPYNDIIGSRWWTRLVRRFLFNRFDAIIFQTEYGRQCFIRDGIKPEKIVVIPIPVDYQFFSRPTGGKAFRKEFGLGSDPFVLMVGIRPLKNPAVVAQACQQAGVTCVLVGPHNKDQVRQTWTTEGFDWYLPPSITESENVIFTGQLTAPQLLAALDAATIYVNSSDYECYGLAVYEAASAGVPLCLPHYGSFDIFKNAALFHPARDPAALAANITTYLDDPTLRKKNGKAGQQIAERNDYPHIKKQMTQLYRAMNII